MSFDILLKGGVLPDGQSADIAISGGRIAAVEPRIEAQAGETIDISGNLVSPPFVDPHAPRREAQFIDAVSLLSRAPFAENTRQHLAGVGDNAEIDAHDLVDR